MLRANMTAQESGRAFPRGSLKLFLKWTLPPADPPTGGAPAHPVEAYAWNTRGGSTACVPVAEYDAATF